MRQAALLLAPLAFLAVSLPDPVAGQEPAPQEIAPWDPTTTDITPIDPEFPPALAPVSIESGGVRLNGYIYLADGPGPHATVVFLPDVPGHERNVDMAQALRRAGYNALIFHYRGTWGSGGDFSWENAVADAGAVVDFVRSADAVERLRTDPERVHLVADGFAAWAALAAAVDRPAIGCIATLGAWNPAIRGRQLQTGDPTASAWRQALHAAADPRGGPIRADPDALLASLAETPERFDLMRAGVGANGKSVLLITSAQFETDPAAQTMLVGASLAGAGAETVERYLINDDQDFSSSRVRVTRSLVTWLESRCPAW